MITAEEKAQVIDFCIVTLSRMLRTKLESELEDCGRDLQAAGLVVLGEAPIEQLRGKFVDDIEKRIAVVEDTSL